MRYRFDDVEVDTAGFELRVAGDRVHLEPQVFEVLVYLIEHRHRLVPRTEILDAVWGDRFVSDGALASRIAAARSAIGDDGRAQRCIRTVHGRGLQFIAPVTLDDAPEPEPADLGAQHQAVRFVTGRDGIRLAVATVGNGRPMVKAANWLTHVEHDWNSPIWRHWWSELGRRFRFVRYDPRGAGLSDSNIDTSDLTDPDLWADDLEAVVDSLDAERFVLLGMSQGAVPAIVYALRHPERVSHLVLYGAYARGMALRGAESAAEAESLLQAIRIGWGGTNPAFRTVFTMTFMPGASSEQMRWFNDVQTRSANTDNAQRLESAFHHLDLGELARKVRVPTMVVHPRHDRVTPCSEGRQLAQLIPDAELVTLESENHILVADEPAWPAFLAHLDRFVAA